MTLSNIFVMYLLTLLRIKLVMCGENWKENSLKMRERFCSHVMGVLRWAAWGGGGASAPQSLSGLKAPSRSPLPLERVARDQGGPGRVCVQAAAGWRKWASSAARGTLCIFWLNGTYLYQVHQVRTGSGCGTCIWTQVLAAVFREHLHFRCGLQPPASKCHGSPPSPTHPHTSLFPLPFSDAGSAFASSLCGKVLVVTFHPGGKKRPGRGSNGRKSDDRVATHQAAKGCPSSASGPALPPVGSRLLCPQGCVSHT